MKYSIVNFLQVNASSDFRMAAEFWHHDRLGAHKKIVANGAISFFENMTLICSGENLLQEESGSYNFIRTQNVKSIIVKNNGMSYTNQRPETLTQKGDLLFVRVGDAGDCSVVTESFINSAVSDNVLVIRVSNINPFFCAVFFNSQLGRAYLKKFSKGTAQGLISKANFDGVLVPKFSDSFQKLMEINCINANLLSEQGNSKYTDAETILLSELGLADWRPKHRLAFTKNYSDTVQAGRIDANYFQPKYEEIENTIKKYTGGYSLIKNEFKQNKSTFATKNSRQYQYVQIGSVNTSSGEITPENVTGEELPANAKRVLMKGNVIVSKVRTYRGAITIVENKGYIGSSAFTVLSESGQINKETLFVFLHSKPLLGWSLKPNTGTSYPVIVDEDILNLPIPLLPEKIQTKIQQKITGSFAMRNQSKRLLECAKRAVEIAIEQDEQTAINWLESESAM